MASSPALQEPTQEPVQADPKRPTMAVKVYTPFKIYFEGEAYSVSGVNATGPFAILPHHHSFLSTIVPCDLKIESPSGQQTFRILRALMHIKSDSLAVFVDV